MTRRAQHVLLGFAAAVALGAMGVLLAGFVWPEVDTEFDLGPIDSFALGSVTSFYLPYRGDQLEPYRHNEFMGVGSYRPQDCRVSGTVIHLVRLEDGSFRALWGRSPHLGQVLPWRPDFQFEGSLGWFRDPCQGSTFAMDGTRVFGPTPRDMDRFRVWVEDGRVYVDLRDVTEGDRYVSPRRPPDTGTPMPTALATEPGVAPSPAIR